jgi:hypothetical protein
MKNTGRRSGKKGGVEVIGRVVKTDAERREPPSGKDKKRNNKGTGDEILAPHKGAKSSLNIVLAFHVNLALNDLVGGPTVDHLLPGKLLSTVRTPQVPVRVIFDDIILVALY